MRVIRDLLAIMLMLAMVAVPAAVSASQCHAQGVSHDDAVSQNHHEHHHAMAGADANAVHQGQGLKISHDDGKCHHAGHGSDNGCLGACCYVYLDAPAYGFPLRAWLIQTTLPLPLEAKADDNSLGLPERPPRLL